MPKKRGAASIGSETSSDQAPRRSARAPKPTQSEGSYESPKKRSRKSPSTESHRHDSNVLEKGLLYFFYRPKLGHSEEVHNFNEVQKFYMLLAPQKMRVRDENPTKRLLIITRKKLPSIHEGHTSKDKVWAFVDIVSKDMHDIHDALDLVHYSTKTRGEREVGPCRPCGEAMYEIIQHESGHTHLAYVLEMPREIGEVQEAFNIYKEAQYLISVKNPRSSSVTEEGAHVGLESSQKAEFPDSLMEKFTGKTKTLRFAPVNPPSFLNHKHAEILMIGLGKDLKEEFGAVGEDLEQMEEEDIQEYEKSGHLETKLMKEIQLEEADHPMEPVTDGSFK